MCLVEYKYYARYIPLLLSGQRPTAEAIITLLTLLLYLTSAVVLGQTGFSRCVWYGWILPGRLAVVWLAYAFDYLPHRPTRSLRTDNEYAATNVTALFGSTTSFLTWPLLHQNYHNIHHLAPYVPFYYYSTVWHATSKELLAQGTVVKPIFGYVDTATKTK